MKPIRLIEPNLLFEEIRQDFEDIFSSGIFTRGKHVELFRQELCAYTGAKYAFLTSSATTALWACMRMLGVGPGDEVIVSDFSWPATANVVEDVGATPIFADVSLDSFNMLPAELERLITDRTKAVIFVDALGNPDGLLEIVDICRRRGIPLVEDAACAAGSSTQGARCGSIADVTCFSFHPRKLVNTGEGGAILTDRDDWANWLEIKLSAGVSGVTTAGANFQDFGYNFRLPEMAAAMGRKQLFKLDAIVNRRAEIQSIYETALAPLGFVAQQCGPGSRHNFQSVVFKVPTGCDRNRMILSLREHGIESTIGTYCLSDTSYFSAKYGTVRPNAKHLAGETLTVPCFDGLNVTSVLAGISETLVTCRV